MTAPAPETAPGPQQPPVRRETCPHKQSPEPHRPGLSSCPEATLKRCTEDGCDKKIVARGLCSTHYNRKHQPNRHPKKAQPCAWCGTEVVKHTRSKARFGVVCSAACRGHLLGVALRGEQKATGTALVHTPRPSTRAAADQRPRPTGSTRTRWFAGTCRTCSAAFVSPHFEKTCGTACAELAFRDAKRADKHRRRALMRGAYVSAVSPRAIYERDNWTCWLCHDPVDRNADPQADRAPSLDHMIPLANGGTHEPANVRTACRGCNARRTNLPTLTSRTGEKVAVLF